MIDNQKRIEALVDETWECRVCHEKAPCQVIITYSENNVTKNSKDNLRFRKQVCVCRESLFPEWKLIDKAREKALLRQCPTCEGSKRKPREKHCDMPYCIKSHQGITCHPNGKACEHYIPSEPCPACTDKPETKRADNAEDSKRA